MTKNSIIGVLIAIILCLVGYIGWENTQPSIPVPAAQTAATTTPDVATATPAPSNDTTHLIYGKTISLQSVQLLNLTLAGGLPSTIATNMVYQAMAATKGKILVKATVKDPDNTQCQICFHTELQTVDTIGNVHSIAQAESQETIASGNTDLIHSAGFSPDGTKIAYIEKNQESDAGPYTENMFVMNADGTSPVQIGTDINATLKKGDFFTMVGWAENGKVYLTAGNDVQEGMQEPGLWAFDTNAKTLSKEDSSSEIFYKAALSPDATKIVYVPYISTSNVKDWVPLSPYSVKTLDLGTAAKTTLLTNTAETYDTLMWSPDGTKLLYGEYDPTHGRDAPGLTTAIPPTFGILDIASLKSTPIADASYLGWASDTKLVVDAVTENSPSTNADDTHTLELVPAYGTGTPDIIDTNTMLGFFFLGAL